MAKNKIDKTVKFATTTEMMKMTGFGRPRVYEIGKKSGSMMVISDHCYRFEIDKFLNYCREQFTTARV